MTTKTDEKERAEFEAWYTAQYTSYIPRSGNGYSNLDTELAWQAYQAGRAALQSQAVIDDDHLSIVLDVYDNAMQKAFDGREFQNPCKPGTPEHKAWEKGTKEGKKKRDAGLPHSIALQSQDRTAWINALERKAEALWTAAGEDRHEAMKDLLHHARIGVQSQDREDAQRSDWLLRQLPGDAIRYCVGDLADTADIDEFRAAIDNARRVEDKT